MGTPGSLRVAEWNVAFFRRTWRTTITSSLLQPLMYLLGLGVGVGALVDRNDAGGSLGGASYVGFVAPGLLVTTAMTLGALDSMWPVMAGLKWQRVYHALAATPLGARDIVHGHGVWILIRSLITAGSVGIVLTLFPDTRSWGLPIAVIVAAIVGLAFAMPIMAWSVGFDNDSAFPAIQRFIITPLFLFGGAFYPLSNLPAFVQWIAKAAPLWHGVVIARDVTTGGASDLSLAAVGLHLAYLALWIVVGAIVAERRLTKKLYA